MKINVVDLFAGPGGLGEGFSAFVDRRGRNPFKIRMSVEKEKSAHNTLLLRAFFRQFARGSVPDDYYGYVKGEISRDALFSAFLCKARAACYETLSGPRELGNAKDDKLIYERLKELCCESGFRVVIGGPPCQAYSLVGRARNRGVSGYSASKDKRHFLYEEYLKVLVEVNPHVFVMENVPGILTAKINGALIFPKIYKELENPSEAVKSSGKKSFGYIIHSLVDGDLGVKDDQDFTIRSEKYGVPQARHRVILVGVREDLGVTPGKLNESQSVSVRDVIDDCPVLRSGISRGEDSMEVWRGVVLSSVKRIRKSSAMDEGILAKVAEMSLKSKSRGKRYTPRKNMKRIIGEIGEWFRDDRLGGYLNHDTRGHMPDDLSRYLYCAAFAKQHERSPRAAEFPDDLAPKHANWKSGKFADRFKVQVASKPSSTVTSHISKDGHYFIHYDPAQCRSLTVREAARLQTFPDSYFFEGNRTQQYVQVGNAVPPWLAKQIAKIVHDVLQSLD